MSKSTNDKILERLKQLKEVTGLSYELQTSAPERISARLYCLCFYCLCYWPPESNSARERVSDYMKAPLMLAYLEGAYYQALQFSRAAMHQGDDPKEEAELAEVAKEEMAKAQEKLFSKTRYKS